MNDKQSFQQPLTFGTSQKEEDFSNKANDHQTGYVTAGFEEGGGEQNRELFKLDVRPVGEEANLPFQHKTEVQLGEDEMQHTERALYITAASA